MPRWIVFDCGEVVCRRTAALPAMAARLGAGLAGFDDAYWRHRDAYDRGLSDLEYWRAVAADAGRGAAVDDAEAAALTWLDTEGWLDVDPAAMALLRDLRRDGASLALLSNAPASFGRAVERQPWSELFQHLLFSGDLGAAKPDPAVWAALVRRLGARPSDCLFWDDRQVNVDGARAAGLGAERWVGAPEARRVLGIA